MWKLLYIHFALRWNCQCSNWESWGYKISAHPKTSLISHPSWNHPLVMFFLHNFFYPMPRMVLLKLGAIKKSHARNKNTPDAFSPSLCFLSLLKKSASTILHWKSPNICLFHYQDVKLPSGPFSPPLWPKPLAPSLAWCSWRNHYRPKRNWT